MLATHRASRHDRKSGHPRLNGSSGSVLIGCSNDQQKLSSLGHADPSTAAADTGAHQQGGASSHIGKPESCRMMDFHEIINTKTKSVSLHR